MKLELIPSDIFDKNCKSLPQGSHCSVATVNYLSKKKHFLGSITITFLAKCLLTNVFYS